MTEKEEPGQLVGFEKMAQRILESFEKRMEQFIQQAVKQSQGTVYNLEGANLQNCAFNGNMTNNGSEKYYEERDSTKTPTYSDEQIARALTNIVGKNRAIDSKQKWAGAQWLLRWKCNYPAKAVDFCEKIASLHLPDDLEYKCDYRNIRELSTLTFMKEDARHMDDVKYSKNDEQIFFQMKEVVVALAEELEKTAIPM